MANDNKKPSVTDGILSDPTSSVVDFNKKEAWDELKRLAKIEESGKTLSNDQKKRRDALLREITARGAAAEGDRLSGEAASNQARGTKARLDAEADILIPAKAAAMRNTSFVGGQPVSSYDMRMFLATTMTMRQRLEKAIALGMPAPYIESLQRLMLGQRNRVEAAKQGRYGLKGYDKNGVAEYGAHSIYDTTGKNFNDAVAAAWDRADNKAYVAAQKRNREKPEANKDAKVDAFLKELDDIEKMTPEEVFTKVNDERLNRTSEGRLQETQDPNDRSLDDLAKSNDTPKTNDTPEINPYDVLGIERPSPDKNDGRQADELGGVMMSPRGWLDAYLSGGAR